MPNLSLPQTAKPHAPTLGMAVVAILIVVVIYHFAFSKKRR